MAAEPNPTLPAPAGAPAPTPSRPPARGPAKSTAALVVEGVVDLVAIVAVTVLAYKGRVDGTWALALVGLLGGVRVTDLASSIRPGSGGGGPGGGAGGLAGLVVAIATGASHALHNLRAVTRLAFATLALGACVSATGCTPPQLPPIAGCVPRDTRCNEAGIPEVCSGSMRWFHLEGSATCASAGLRCCRNRDQSPQPIYSCVPPSACIPEPESAPTDAGVSDAE